MSVMGKGRGWLAAACLACAVASAHAQQQQQPAQPPKPAQESNPFPGDNGNAPIIPTDGSAPAAASDDADTSKVTLADPNADPVRSPDQDMPAAASAGSSSSSAGIDSLIEAPPEPERKGRHSKDEGDQEPVKQVGPKDDEEVGAYYLETKNWKAALSRFQSALVLDPENPDVYWGLGEAQRHMGQFAEAKANYQKVLDYDPDSKHGKEAKKLLKSSELANAPAVSAVGAPAQP